MAVEERGQAARAPIVVGAGMRWLLAAVWMAGISWLSSQPDSSLPDVLQFRYHDKVEHLAFYIVLGALLWWAFRASTGVAGGVARWAVLVGGLFAASDEIHQRFVPTRRAEWPDWGADLVGVMIGAVAAWLLSRAALRRRKGAEDATDR
jgi:VanZ family protein